MLWQRGAQAGQPGFFDRDSGTRCCRRPGTRSRGWRWWSTSSCSGRRSSAPTEPGGRPPYDAVLMFKVLVLQTLYTLSDDQTEYQIRDRLSLMRFLGLALEDRVPDAKTIWLFREQLTKTGAVQRLFERFDAALRDAGYLAMGGQIVDATVIQARRPRLSGGEKATIKGGGVPSAWSKAKRAQMDTEGRWTLKRGRRRSADRSGLQKRIETELVIPVFGYKNHLGIDRRHGFIRNFLVTDAATQDGRQLGRLLDPDNTASAAWADSAYRSAANVVLLARRGLVPQFQRPKPRGKAMPPHLIRGNAGRARVRVAIEDLFAAQKCRLGLVIRSVGLARPPPASGSPIWSPTCAAWSGSRPERPRPEEPATQGRPPYTLPRAPVPALTADPRPPLTVIPHTPTVLNPVLRGLQLGYARGPTAK
jgi:IS5 family transposase